MLGLSSLSSKDEIPHLRYLHMEYQLIFMDECVRIGERIIIKNQKKFCKMVDTIFPNEYLIGRQITLTLLGWHLLKWKKCLTTLGMAILPHPA